jgi:hypothetical protein
VYASHGTDLLLFTIAEENRIGKKKKTAATIDTFHQTGSQKSNKNS